MSALVEDSVLVAKSVRKLRGGSQPVLVEGSDGFRYVVKFINNLQGPNVLFNEAMGNELYCALGLPVPTWKPLTISKEFLDQTPQCWFETADGLVRPEPGPCFGSRYLGRDGVKLWEILPGSSIGRITNRRDFFLAWLVDICANHFDNRQAVFEEGLDGLRAVFLDHGHMFSGPCGANQLRNYFQPAHLDKRVYDQNPLDHGKNIATIVLNLDIDALWREVEKLPIEWLTKTSLQNLAKCLDRLSNRNAVESIAELIAGFPVKKDQREFLPNERLRGVPYWLLCTGVQGA